MGGTSMKSPDGTSLRQLSKLVHQCNLCAWWGHQNRRKKERTLLLPKPVILLMQNQILHGG